MDEKVITEFRNLVKSGEILSRLRNQPGVNLELPVIDAEIYWTNEEKFLGWKIQKHRFTGHLRILGPDHVRYAFGTEKIISHRIMGQPINIVINALRTPQQTASEHFCRFPAVGARRGVVILVHGWSTRACSMTWLAEKLSTKGLEAICYDYCSSTQSISELAVTFYRELRALPEIRANIPIFLLTHSMGGLLTRKMLELDTANAVSGKISQIVMLGPPNQGSALADLAASIPLVTAVNHSIDGMRRDRNSEVNSIKAPAHYRKTIGIIGGKFDGKVNASSLPIPDYPCEITMVPCTHPGLRKSLKALVLALRFFRDGTFRQR